MAEKECKEDSRSTCRVHVLNAPRSAIEVSQDLQKLMQKMKADFMTEDGRGVNYDGLRSSQMYQQYLSQCRELTALDLTQLDLTQTKVFFINLYNALTLHGLVSCSSLPRSVLDLQEFWRRTAYSVGGHTFSLDDMEHGVLRGNRAHPVSKAPCFQPDDARLQFSIKELDPRIHFALVCGAKSCPPIGVYSESNLERALSAATTNFISQEVTVDTRQHQISLSKIFLWYQTDFGADQMDVARWIKKYSKPDMSNSLGELLQNADEGQGAKVRFSYNNYDWNLNKS